MLKLFSLKGYEVEVYDAHDDEIIKLGFVPNKGLLVSIDSGNILKLWLLSDLDDCEIEIKIPHSNNPSCVSCLYIPALITSQPMNHDHFFIGMDDGDIYVFDLTIKTFSKFKVDYKLLFPDKPATAVADIKCHPLKMHRLLIAYERTAIAVFSMNKNRIIQRIMLSPDGPAKTPRGTVLAVEWLGPEYREFVAGFDQNVV